MDTSTGICSSVLARMCAQGVRSRLVHVGVLQRGFDEGCQRWPPPQGEGGHGFVKDVRERADGRRPAHPQDGVECLEEGICLHRM